MIPYLIAPSPGWNRILDEYSGILVFIAAVPATLFPIVYSRRPWRASFLGRALMVKATGLALLIDISLLYVQFGDDYPYRQLVRAAVYTLITTGIILQFTALCVAPWSRDLSDEHEHEDVDR